MSLLGKLVWNIILFIITVKIIHHIKIPIENKNHDNSLNHNAIPDTGANIFHTIGKNRKGFIDSIFCFSIIHLLKIITLNVNCKITHTIHNIVDIFIFICKNHIDNIKNIFHNHGKKFDLTGWLKSVFTSLKFTNILAKYAIHTNMK
jgi:hypothetical protein